MTILLKNWGTRCEIGDDKLRLCGNVYGHPEIPDGEWIASSQVEYFDSERRVFVAQRGREYVLVGDPDPVYVQVLREGHPEYGVPPDPDCDNQRAFVRILETFQKVGRVR